MPVTQGVVGAAFRTKSQAYDKLPNNTSVAEYLVSAHGFDQQQAASMRKDRRSWAAIPVGEHEILAVIFLDSCDRDFFGKANSGMRPIVENAAIAVAKYLEVK